MKNDKNNVANLFIVGGMKCGTTILRDYLCSHPDVFGPEQKEIHYFSLHEHKGVAWYNAHFDEDGKFSYQLDASPTYLDLCNSGQIPNNIRAYNENAKVIILVRDPIMRAISHFNHLKNVNQIPCLQQMAEEEFFSFKLKEVVAEATPLNEYRRRVMDFSLYYQKILQFLHVFGEDNVCCIHNEDLRSSGQAVMDRVFEFLDLSPVTSEFFAEEKYLAGTSQKKLSLATQVSLADIFGPNYYETCRLKAFTSFQERLNVAQTYSPQNIILDDLGIGTDDTLFLVRGSNDVIDGYLTAHREKIEGWSKLIQQRAVKAKALGCTYLHVPIPEKLSIYGDRFMADISLSDGFGEKLLSRLEEEGCESVVSLFSLFRQHRDDGPLYLKTDSHWSGRGAFLAYQMICSKLGLEFDKDLLDSPYHEGDLTLDLGSKLEPAVREKVRFHNYAYKARVVYENDIVRYKREHDIANEGRLHVGSHISWANDKPVNDISLLLFGDSFSEFRETLLSGLLASSVRSFTFVWSISIDWKLVEEMKPDILISAHTERFMTSLPDDTMDIQAFSKRRLAEYISSIS